MTEAGRRADLGTAVIGEATPEARLLDVPLRPLAPDMRGARPARTVRCRPGAYLAPHRAIAADRSGEVVVADYGGSTARGSFGEIPARACIRHGIARMVIDGAARDIVRIAEMGFAVFARGISIRGTVKQVCGDTGLPLQIRGAGVRPGDLLVAENGAVIVPPADAAKQRYGRSRRAPPGKP